MSRASLNENDDWISYEELVDHVSSNTNPSKHADTNPFYEFYARNEANGKKSRLTCETPQEGISQTNPFRNGLLALAKITASSELPPLPPRPCRHRTPPPIPPRTNRDYKYTKEQLWEILCSKTYQSPRLPDKLKPSFFKVTERIISSSIPDAYFSDSEDLHRIRIIVYLLPDQFTFQHDLDEIEKLQRRLKKFYNEHHDTEIMKAKKLFSGQAAVVMFRGEWYRAEVKNYDKYSARVQFIDHMRFALFEVNRNDIYYLHRRFEKIPKKSAIGGIDGIVPLEKRWTTDEIKKVRNILPYEVMASVEGYVSGIWKFSLFDATGKGLKDIILKHGAAKDAKVHHE